MLIPFQYQAARELLHWDKDFITTTTGDFTNGNVAWFLEGELNVSYNCVDRHAFSTPNKVAL
jgi:acetyl-CoA synthetase